MLGIGGTELVIIAMVALFLFGPDKLPQFARTLGRFLRDFKRYQDMMESTIRAEMYASEGTSADPFKKGKNFREKVQAEKAEAEAAARAEKEPAEKAADEAPADKPAEKPAKEPAAEETPAESEHTQREGEHSTSTEE